MKVVLILGLAIASSLLISAEGFAQSLWQHRKQDFALFFVDTRAHNIGDQLTIIIFENTDVNKRDQRALDKSSDGGFNFNFASSGSGGGAANGSVNIAGDSSRAFDGNSQYRVAQEFSDRIAVRVVGLLPNGYLQVEGIRSQIVADEKRVLRVSGIVRPMDVTPENTVQSQFVANLDINYEACGSESHFTNQGWAARALNRVWPF